MSLVVSMTLSLVVAPTPVPIATEVPTLSFPPMPTQSLIVATTPYR
jgi:hypothetical protein